MKEGRKFEMNTFGCKVHNGVINRLSFSSALIPVNGVNFDAVMKACKRFILIDWLLSMPLFFNLSTLTKNCPLKSFPAGIFRFYIFYAHFSEKYLKVVYLTIKKSILSTWLFLFHSWQFVAFVTWISQLTVEDVELMLLFS